jgi:RND family efflux transporter MFP subunit
MSEHAGKKGLWLVVALAAIAIVVGIRFVAESVDEIPDAVEAEALEAGGTVSFLMEQQWLIQLKLAQAESATLAPQITSTGRVVPAPRHHALVAPPVGGIVSGSPLPQLGEQVTQGQLIATLVQTPTAAEATEIRVEETRIEAERRRLSELRAQAEARLEFARSEFERAGRLYEQGAWSLRQRESAEAEFKAVQAELAAVRAQLEALEAPASAMSHEVRAPISGAVIRVNKRFGEQVQAGEPILEIADTSRVWVEVPIFERDLGRLAATPVATFTTPTFPGREFTSSVVIDAGDVIDEDTRAAMFVFEAANPDGLLRIGMQANLRLDADEQVEALLVPKEAVLDNEGQKIVYVLLSGETFQRRNVTVGDEYGDTTAILSGIEEGERVVTQGAYQLKLQELAPADPGAHTHEV